MAEETGQVESEVVEDQAIPPQDVQPGSFVNADGTLKEGWKSLVPEDFRGRKVFDKISDLPGVFKMLGNADALIGRQGKGVMPPDEKATQSEWDVFYDALGRPKAPEGYKLETPKGLEDYYDNGLIQEARAVFHGIGLTQKQADGLWAFEQKRLEAGVKQAAEAEAAAVQEAEGILRAKWGQAYDQRLHMANRMIAENVSEADKPRLIAAIGNNPYVADFLSNIAKKFMEHKIIDTDSGGSGAMTPAEAESRMKELIAERGKDQGMKWNNPEKYKRLNEEINRLAAASITE